jgi:nucleotidyltransferase substrate binding protein, HI0074 family
MNEQINIHSLGNALARFDESLRFELSQPLVVDASIQRFEFCVELTWKTLKECLAAEGIEANTPRECIQQAYRIHWINDEGTWLSVLHDRSMTTYTYKEELALEIYRRLPLHNQVLLSLYHQMKRRFSDIYK